MADSLLEELNAATQSLHDILSENLDLATKLQSKNPTEASDTSVENVALRKRLKEMERSVEDLSSELKESEEAYEDTLSVLLNKRDEERRQFKKRAHARSASLTEFEKNNETMTAEIQALQMKNAQLEEEKAKMIEVIKEAAMNEDEDFLLLDMKNSTLEKENEVLRSLLGITKDDPVPSIESPA